jgi:hypothetical protein
MFAKTALESGGFIRPLLVSPSSMKGPSLSNPSIFRNKKGELLVNIRNLNYVLYHSERGVFEHGWGPLCYLHKENDLRLATDNILCRLDENFGISSSHIVDMALDEEPLWEFVGLEDGRLVEWGGKLYLSGVRRDTTTNGQGRMELSEMSIKKDRVVERSRVRIPAPGADASYCEKNWMPVLDKEYTYVKWTNPTEVVEVDPASKTCKTTFLGTYEEFGTGDLRGGSQVVPLGDDRYVAVVHEVRLYKSESGKKNADYGHRFAVWNRDFELIKVSDSFKFMDAKIEFCCGMAEYKDKFLITFGLQDNSAHLLGIPKQILGGILN